MLEELFTLEFARKTENRDYSATILEEDGDLWNQVQRYIAIYRR